MTISQGDASASEPATQIELVQLDVVVDIQATSRYGGVADTAFLRSSAVTADRPPVTTSQAVPVFEDNGRFKLTVTVPPGYATLREGTEFTVLLLLPRDGERFRVELAEYTTDYDPQVFDGAQNPKLGGRIAVMWRGHGTDLSGVWIYPT